MYFVIIALCFVVGPIMSIIIERLVRRHRPDAPDLLTLVLRWFTFWIVGVRLFTAGVVQALRPEFTAEQIFNTTDPAVLPFISELGYANIAMGVVGILTLVWRGWVPPAALLGAIFLGLDGIRHLADGGAFTPDRTLAMVTDLIAVVVLGGCLIAVAVTKRRQEQVATN